MEHLERNASLLPFLAVSAAVSAALCLRLHAAGAAVLGLFLLLFLAAYLALWLLLVLALLLLSIGAPDAPQMRRRPFFVWLVGHVEGMMLAAARVRIHATGLEKLPAGHFLLVCNHRSNFDPIVLGWTLRNCDLAFVAKPVLLSAPVMGAILRKANYLAINREDNRAALKSILAAAALIWNDVSSVGIFPEGTRNTGAELLPLRTGAFKIAQRANAPIAIAALRGSDQVRRRAPWRHTDIHLELCAVLPAAQVAEMNTFEIGEEVRKCITSAVC